MFTINRRLAVVLCLAATAVASLAGASTASAWTTLSGRVLVADSDRGAGHAYVHMHYWNGSRWVDPAGYSVRADAYGRYAIVLDDGVTWKPYATWAYGSCSAGTRRIWTGWWPYWFTASGERRGANIRVYRRNINPCGVD